MDEWAFLTVECRFRHDID